MLTRALHRRRAIELIDQEKAPAWLASACGVLFISLRTLKRWRKAFLGEWGWRGPPQGQ